MKKMAPVRNEREINIDSIFLRFWLILPTTTHAEIKSQLVKTQKRNRRCTKWMPSAGILQKKTPKNEKNKKKLMRESCEDSQGLQEQVEIPLLGLISPEL